MADLMTLANYITEKFSHWQPECTIAHHELTVELAASSLQKFCREIKDDPNLLFTMLIDICGVDYSHYGQAEWETTRATSTGFERGVKRVKEPELAWQKPRFAAVYHLLSIPHNHRLRIKCFADGEPPLLDSVIDIWPVANWFEREAFDLFGIIFNGHPDLRRILTDYGFIGHPFRKDFPLSGNVEVRYDAAQQRVIYEPVQIEPRVLVPKVIRSDNRYEQPIAKGK